MKVAAHPMLVAVALGLLGPNALANETAEDERARRAPAADRAGADRTDDMDKDQVMSALEDESAPYWTRLSLAADEADSWSTDSEG